MGINKTNIRSFTKNNNLLINFNGLCWDGLSHTEGLKSKDDVHTYKLLEAFFPLICSFELVSLWQLMNCICVYNSCFSNMPALSISSIQFNNNKSYNKIQKTMTLVLLYGPHLEWLLGLDECNITLFNNKEIVLN